MSQPEGSHPEFSSQRTETVWAASTQGGSRRKAASMLPTITRWRSRLRAVMSKGTAGRKMPYAKTGLARRFSHSTASARPQGLRSRIFSRPNAALRHVWMPDVRVLATRTLECDEHNFHRRTRFVSDAPSRTSLQKAACPRVRSRTRTAAFRNLPFLRRFQMRAIARSCDLRFGLRRVRRWPGQRMLLSKFPRRGALRFEVRRAFEPVSKIPAVARCLNSRPSPPARQLEREQGDTIASRMASFQLFLAHRCLHRNIASADVRESSEPCARRPPIECIAREFGAPAYVGSRRDSSARARGTRANSETSSTNNRAAG